MNLLRESGIVKPFLVLLFIFLALKGWVLLSLLDRGEAATCLAEPAVAEATAGSPAPDPGGEACDLRMGALIQKIREEETRLEEKAARLEEKDRRLQIYGHELVEKMNNLDRLKLEVQKIHQQIEQYEDEKQQRLVKIYDAMDPESAAQRLEAMDDALGSWLLLRINVRKAGQVLGALSPEKASRITTRLRGENPHSAKEIEKALASSRAKTASKGSAVTPSIAEPKKVARNDERDLSEARLLQIGTFSDANRADTLVEALQKKGYRSFQKEWVRGKPEKTYYKVFVGPCPDPKKASEMKLELEKKEGYQGILIRTPAAAGV
jgi:flagellar motility protein MotE (MotC chaperone)